MRRIIQYVKRMLCTSLSITMLLMDMNVSVYAAEFPTSENIEQEQIENTTETQQNRKTDERIIEIESETSEEISIQETTRAEEQAAKLESEQLEETEILSTAIEENTESSIEVMTELYTQNMEASSGIDTVETEEMQTEEIVLFSDTDIAHGVYKENNSNVTWVVDRDGKLIVEGTGDFAGPLTNDWQINQKRAPWSDVKEKIISAEIKMSGTTNAACMFYGCSNLKSINLNNFDTSNVENMRYMFSGCSSLMNLDLSSLDTTKVSDMCSMFEGCNNLIGLELSGLTTSNVERMDYMFWNCSSLTNLDISGFDTSRVKNMGGMFSGCSGLTRLDIDGFNTNNVLDMGSVFWNCSSLTNLDISGFNTSRVESMQNMFHGCSSITGLDLTSFDTSNVTNMEGMLSECSGLITLNVSSFNTEKVTNMSFMFAGCSNLTNLEIQNFDTVNVEDMCDMFHRCKKLNYLDLSSFDTGNVTRMDGMFSSCNSLTGLKLDNFDTRNVTNMYNIFGNCDSLTSLDLSMFDMTHVTSSESMLHGAASSLTLLYTPRNLTGRVLLPVEDSSGYGKLWYDTAGNEYETLPQNKAESILLSSDKNISITEKITVKKTKKTYHCGEHIDTDDIVITYYAADGTVKQITDGFTTNADSIDNQTAGEKTLEVTYTPANEDNTSSAKPLTASITLTFTYSMENALTVTLPDETYVYNGTPFYPVPTVTCTVNGDTKTLTEMVDYTVRYENNIDAYEDSTPESLEHAPAIIVKGCGQYSGSVRKNFTIKKADAPAAEELVVEITDKDTETERSLELADSFAAYGNKTGYIVETPIEDNTVSGNVLSGMPSVNSSGLLSYIINKDASTRDFVTIPVTISFKNYKDTVLNIKIIFSGNIDIEKQKVIISDIEVENKVYDKMPVSPVGIAKVQTEDGMDVTKDVKLHYTYSGSAYDTSTTPPINAGNYILTVSVSDDNALYAGSRQYPFTISEASLVIAACDMGLKIGADLPKKEEFKYDVKGLLNGDTLITEPVLKCDIVDSSKAGIYDIIVSGADAGKNYDISYIKGTLTVSETGESTVYYTVTFNLSGKGSDIIQTNIKQNSIITQPTDPTAEGFIFTGWYKEQTCITRWNFTTDQVTSDLILYAGWKAKDDNDDSSYPAAERQDLSTLNASIAGIRPQTYNRDEQEPAVKVTAFVNGRKTTLTEGMDYRVSYKNNIDAGTAIITIKGNGAYKGTLTQNFTIRPKAVKKLKVVVGALSKNVSVSDLSLYPIHVYDGVKRLNFGTDYTLSSAGMTKNTVKVSIAGKGNYTGTMTAKLSVYSVSSDHIINPDQVRLDKDTAAYTGKPVKTVNPIVTVNGSTLTLNQDYKVKYQNNTNAGTAYVIVTGKGAYKGRVVLPFQIQPAAVSAGTVTIKPISAKTYNGKLQKPAVSVTVLAGGKTKKLVKNKDYKITYKDNLHAGTSTVLVTGKGNYAGMKAQTQFTIQPQSIAKTTIKGTQSSLQLTYNKRLLKQGVHYEAPSYGGSRKNKVQVTIKGKGDFTGQITKYIKKQ